MELPKKWGKLVKESTLRRCIQLIPENPVPRRELIFRAFQYFDPAQCQIVILGQDPYPDLEAAEGLSFSTTKLRVSISRIFNSLIKNGLLDEKPKTADLESWAERGVLLLNSMLTYSPKKDTHWLAFTMELLQNLMMLNQDTVVFAWGEDAKKICAELPPVRVLGYVHPAARTGVWNFQDFLRVPALFLERGGYSMDRFFRVYTDGACSGNGKKWAKGGWACVFHRGLRREPVLKLWARLSENEIFMEDNKLKYRMDTCKPATNIRAEMFAITAALWKILTTAGPSFVEIITDSDFSIKVCTDWMYKWAPNFENRCNPDIVRVLYQLCAAHKKISFVFQPAHLKDPKTENEIGNAAADVLAVAGKLMQDTKTQREGLLI
jgi:uracil-DNA glycosylase